MARQSLRTRAAGRNASRDRTGLSATLVDTETGVCHSFAAAGPMRTALREVAALCDYLGPTWRVRSLSTVASIRADLANAGHESTMRIGRVEGMMLGPLGRADLIETPMLREGRGATQEIARRRRGQ